MYIIKNALGSYVKDYDIAANAMCHVVDNIRDAKVFADPNQAVAVSDILNGANNIGFAAEKIDEDFNIIGTAEQDMKRTGWMVVKKGLRNICVKSTRFGDVFGGVEFSYEKEEARIFANVFEAVKMANLLNEESKRNGRNEKFILIEVDTEEQEMGKIAEMEKYRIASPIKTEGKFVIASSDGGMVFCGFNEDAIGRKSASFTMASMLGEVLIYNGLDDACVDLEDLNYYFDYVNEDKFEVCPIVKID